MRRAAVAVLGVLALIGSPGTASGQIVVGPYVFPDESPFADTAFFHPNPAHTMQEDYLLHWSDPTPPGWPEVEPGEWMLIGYSPEYGLVNLGDDTRTPCEDWVPYHGRELLDFSFVDVVAVNGPGADLVIFDAGADASTYEVAVRPSGGTITPFRFYSHGVRVPTGHPGPSSPIASLEAIEIDLTAYAIPPGVAVDLIRIAGDRRAIDGCPSADPVMAAVLNSPCSCDDGNECTWDCGAGGCASVPHSPGTPCSTGVCDGAPTPSCVECLQDSDCPATAPRCDSIERRCLSCVDDTNCDDENDCTSDVCTDEGLCEHRTMADGASCGASGNQCLAGACVECAEASDCDQGIACVIDTCESGRCEARVAPRGSACDGGRCNGDVAEPLCSACLSDGDCEPASPFCADSGQCVECRRDGHCASACRVGSVCDDGSCTGESAAPGTPCAGGVCGPDASCVECLVAADCDDGRPCTRDVCSSSICLYEERCEDGGLSADAGTELEPPSGCGCATTPGPALPAWFTVLAGCLLYRRRR